MTNERLRRAIVVEAARLMYSRNQTEYYRAKLKAAKRLCKGWVKPAELPTNAEIRDEIQRMANLFEGSSRFDRLREMRVEALRVMRLLCRFRPKIIGSTFTRHVRHGSDIDIHIFAASTEPVESCLDAEGFDYRVERKVVRKHGEERIFTHLHIHETSGVRPAGKAGDQRGHRMFEWRPAERRPAGASRPAGRASRPAGTQNVCIELHEECKVPVAGQAERVSLVFSAAARGQRVFQRRDDRCAPIEIAAAEKSIRQRSSEPHSM